MEIIPHPGDLSTKFFRDYFGRKTIGFVPTMGALHPGHASLVQKSKAENDLTAVSIFVNPTQFGPKEDFSRYPRTPEADLEILKTLGVDVVFMPEPAMMYPNGTDEVKIHLSSMDQVLCGASRPGHFNGVVQVVNKLLNIVKPTRAYFGLKDFQQWTIIRLMAEEFFHHTEIVGCPTVREADGLAMSSRNRFIAEADRPQALFLFKAMSHVKEHAKPGAEANALIRSALEILKDFPAIKLDYFDIRREHDLSAPEIIVPGEKPRVFIAAWCGTPRLIDNLALV